MKNSKRENEAATRFRKEFIVSLSNEMRAVLIPFLCFPDILLENNLDQEQSDYLQMIESEGFLINELIQKELERARNRIKLQKGARRRFSAKVGDGAKTPLNHIVRFSELLLESNLDQEQSEYIQTIKSHCFKFIEMINDLEHSLRKLSSKVL